MEKIFFSNLLKNSYLSVSNFVLIKNSTGKSVFILYEKAVFTIFTMFCYTILSLIKLFQEESIISKIKNN